jgi:hypothetical protein
MSDFIAGSSFEGWLLKYGSKIVPNKYLAYDDYTATPNQRTEVEAYRDLNNLLHRDTSPNFKTKIDFNTRPLYLAEKIDLQSTFASGLVKNRSLCGFFLSVNPRLQSLCKGQSRAFWITILVLN